MKRDFLRTLGRAETFVLGFVIGMIFEMFALAFLRDGCV